VRRAPALLVLATAALVGCSDQGPVAGELSVRLATPRSTDRAVLLSVVGRQHGVTAGTGSSYRVVSDTSATGDTVWIAVIAPQGSGLAAGEIARLVVPDTRRAGAYRAVLTDVAAADYSVGDTAGVSLSVVKP
jgi:type IV pilus biogenesis protein CpaD/CtpE